MFNKDSNTRSESDSHSEASESDTETKLVGSGQASTTEAKKAQPWKKFWPPSGSRSGSDGTSDSDASPWLNWKPDPNKPDEKPWIQWMNEKKFNPALEQRAGRDAYPVRKRSPSPRATVAEGG